MKKEFEFNFAEMGDFFTTSWTAKKLKFGKSHFKEIKEELRLENLTASELNLVIEEHDLLKHPRRITLEPKEVKHIIIKIPCDKIKKIHKSELVIKSKNQTERIPIEIEHN